MKHLLIFVGVLFVGALGLALPSMGSEAEPACGPITVQANVAVQDGEFSLTDLLPPDICPAFRGFAARVPLGRAPLPGSVRVLKGEEIRALIRALLDKSQSRGTNFLQKEVIVQVPERITVHRAGARASCSDLAGAIAQTSLTGRTGSLTGENLVRDEHCGAAGRIQRNVPIAIAKTVWNPALTSWEITARCLEPRDCVPFLVSARASSLPADTLSSAKLRAKLQSHSSTESPMTRPGQSMTLFWDQDGIRMILSVTCLDRGGLGETVRARVQHGDRVLRAKVINAETLRMQL
jgi:hypothetical protein